MQRGIVTSWPVPAALGASLSTLGCSSAEPTPDMNRSAQLVLGASVAGGTQRLGECLEAAGYDIDRGAVAREVERGADINSLRNGGSTAVYRVRVDGDDNLHFAVVSESGAVVTVSQEDERLLDELGCALG